MGRPREEAEEGTDGRGRLKCKLGSKEGAIEGGSDSTRVRRNLGILAGS